VLHDIERKKFARVEHSREAGLVGGVEYMDARLGYEISRLDMLGAFSELQSARARFVNTVGYDAHSFYKPQNEDLLEGGAV